MRPRTPHRALFVHIVDAVPHQERSATPAGMASRYPTPAATPSCISTESHRLRNLLEGRLAVFSTQIGPYFLAAGTRQASSRREGASAEQRGARARPNGPMSSDSRAGQTQLLSGSVRFPAPWPQRIKQRRPHPECAEV
jgi:hypothetical protein